MKKWIKDIITYVIIIALVILLRSFVATPIKVSGKSMNPTLEGNEVMLLNRLSKIKRYDIVVVNINSEKIIKRVYALPGEKIEIKNNKVYINDEIIDDPYGKGITSNIKPITLGDDEYFVLGDNREDSLDSRILGPMKRKKVLGTAGIIIFPLKKMGVVY